MDAIFFLHHLPLHEPVTRKHLALFRALNRDCVVIPLKFDEGRKTPQWQWANVDILVLEHFDKFQPTFDRYYLMEADCFSSQSLREFYGKSYDRPVVGSIIVKPWSREIIPNPHGEPVCMKDWHWFEANESAELYPYLRGICPTSGTMFSHAALFDIVQIWKTNRAFDNLFSECRLGTLAAMSGREPETIRPDCHKFLCAGDAAYDGEPGCYHRVRL